MASNGLPTLPTFKKELTAIFLEYAEEFEGSKDMIEAMAKYAHAQALKMQKAPPAAAAATGSSGKRAPNKYAQFMKRLSQHNKDAPIDKTVKPVEHFTNKESKSYATYQEQGLDALIGEEIQFGEFFTQVHEITGNLLKTTGIMWGLLSEEDRAAVLAA
jgi:hypothetical protein